MVDAQVQLWLWDHDISASLVIESALDAHSDIRQVLRYMEWSLHGIPWIVASSISLTIMMRLNSNSELTHKFAILLFGLCIDLVCVGIIKVFVRRPRPVYDRQDQVYEAAIADRFSFPSGHSSRSAMLAVLALSLCSPPDWIVTVLKIFPFLLGLSRVVMGRHYISDVLAGLTLGWLEGHIVQLLPQSAIPFLKRSCTTLFGTSRP
uniref:Phosphatidic acid phosphatase type 2/haloperoxidase domain-containing protein n=1 Tax=Parascaris univalens TaxID=6257 RepID=A0A914ZUM0_PARUN